MNRYMLCAVLSIGALCLAESFLAKKPVKRRSRLQLKQEISQRMGSLIELSSKSLEREAQIQQKLCKELRYSVEGAKESMLNRVPIKKLQKISADLQQEQQRRVRHQAAQERFLVSLS